ncbi:hypothetical protein ACFL35_16920 [Candidatus Riflebacteria bacterium]
MAEIQTEAKTSEFELVDILLSVILISLLLIPILRLNSLDSYSFSNNAETIKAVRLAQDIMEQVKATDDYDKFPKSFSPLKKEGSSFAYKVNITPSDLGKGDLLHIGVSLRWGGHTWITRKYFSLHSLKSTSTGMEVR